MTLSKTLPVVLGRLFAALLLTDQLLPVASAASGEGPANSKTVTLQVQGMTCGGCAAMIEGALSKIKGVQTARVSLKEELAVVQFDPAQVDEKELVAAVEKAGYKAGVVSDAHGNTAAQAAHHETSSSVQARQPAGPEMVPAKRLTFYQVDLVCRAAPKIGCGGRAKPVLHALLAEPRVEGAWLNEAGTRLAIGWKDARRAMGAEELDKALEERGLKAHEVTGEDRAKLFAALRSGWYDVDSLDELSHQEAGIIARRLVKRLAARTELTASRQAELRTAIEQAFRARFEKKLKDDGDERVLSATKSYLNPSELARFREVLSLGYRPLEGEE